MKLKLVSAGESVKVVCWLLVGVVGVLSVLVGTSVVGRPLYIAGLAFQPNGMKFLLSRGPIGKRG